ncbi:uncharacterized protein LOC112083072 [Eutrema salsugineum]|uniref:uncharacterized protein LOC112083072 n=1 Tax=Eutrema salsugineum TaxID=72664 RepID=UPI000CED3AA8|nr:uncharacterized protein LOC112083072 [Eutrema salsugineum]
MTSFRGNSELLQLTLWEPLYFRSEVEEQTRNEQTRNDEENQPPMQPLMENLESPSLGLRPEELRWFSEHLQFKHFWHMHKAMYLDITHKTQGLWMLLLRTAKTNKRRECWFVVNEVPIWYSLKEHALISGLDCHDYPKNYEKMGSSDFKEKYLKKRTVSALAVVKEKLEKMCGGPDRLRMCVLYFLASLLGGKAKTGKGPPSVDPLF